jgi:antitoxin component YwqK of YwqJK toxin-antitoxin module
MVKPVITCYPNGNKKSENYYLNNQYHNTNGPAGICYYEDGNKKSELYLLNNELHNENGPAEIYYHPNGDIKSEYYYLNDRLLVNVTSLEDLKRYIKLNNVS